MGAFGGSGRRDGDDTHHGIGAIESGAGAPDHFDTVDEFDRDG